MWNDKPDGYPIPAPNSDGYEYEFLPVGMGTGTNFYSQHFCWRAGNCSTRPEPDPLPSLSSTSLICQKLMRWLAIFEGFFLVHYVTEVVHSVAY
jgi:hypothetical protein